MVVRMRATRAHTRNRRSHHALSALSLAQCQSCGASILRHRACPHCGNYRGKKVIDVAAKAQKRAEKAVKREKAIAAQSGRSGQSEKSEKSEK